VEIHNPDLHLATLNEKGKLEIELTDQRGRGACRGMGGRGARAGPPMRRTIPTKRRAAATRSTSSPAPKPFPYPLRAVGGIASSTSSVLAKTTFAASMCASPSTSSPS